jgi:hypothetical protein
MACKITGGSECLAEQSYTSDSAFKSPVMSALLYEKQYVGKERVTT